MSLPEKIANRVEAFLNNIAGGGADLPEKPRNNIERYLDYIARNGGGGGDSSEPFIVKFGMNMYEPDEYGDYRFSRDKTNAEIEAAFLSGKKVLAQIWDGYYEDDWWQKITEFELTRKEEDWGDGYVVTYYSGSGIYLDKDSQYSGSVPAPALLSFFIAYNTDDDGWSAEICSPTFPCIARTQGLQDGISIPANSTLVLEVSQAEIETLFENYLSPNQVRADPISFWIDAYVTLSGKNIWLSSLLRGPDADYPSGNYSFVFVNPYSEAAVAQYGTNLWAACQYRANVQYFFLEQPPESE